MEFIGRDAELGALRAEFDRARQGEEGRFAWVQGRRRVGKSRLVQSCNRLEAPYVFYQAPQRGVGAAIAAFVDAVAQSTLPAASAFEGASFESWPTAIRAAVQGIDPARPGIVVIDELPVPRGGRSWVSGRPSASVGPTAREHASAAGLHRLRRADDGEPGRRPIAASRQAHAGAAGGAAEPGRGRQPHLRARFGGGIRPLPDRGRLSAAGGLLAERSRDTSVPAEVARTRPIAVRRHRPADHGLGVPARAAGEGRARGDRTRRGLLRPHPGTQWGEGQHTQRRAGSAGRAEAPGCEGAALRRSQRQEGSEYIVTDPYLRFWLRFVGPHMEELSRGRPELSSAGSNATGSSTGEGRSSRWCGSRLERLLADPSLSARLGGARHVGAWWRRDHSIEVDLVGGDRPDPGTIGFIGSVEWRRATAVLRQGSGRAGQAARAGPRCRQRQARRRRPQRL